MDIVKKAEEFAREAHKNHVRNDEAKTPYVFHLEEVARLIRESGGTDEEVASGWLHDTVEDTNTTMEDIRREFGNEIGGIVLGMTDPKEWRSFSLKEQKSMQAERIKEASNSTKRVKLADQTSNVRIVGLVNDNFTLDQKFIYIDGAKEIAEVCQGISPYLDKLFSELYESAYKNLTSIQESTK